MCQLTDHMELTEVAFSGFLLCFLQRLTRTAFSQTPLPQWVVVPPLWPCQAAFGATGRGGWPAAGVSRQISRLSYCKNVLLSIVPVISVKIER